MRSNYGQNARLQESSGVAALILAAGLGRRMLPFTRRIPKPLLTVNNQELLDRSYLEALKFTSDIAVNAHHQRDAIIASLAGKEVHLSIEDREPLGTAGAVGGIREWLDGRDVLIMNSDTWVEEIPSGFITSWDHERPRLLVVDTSAQSDFGTRRFVGVSLLPGATARALQPERSGLYERVWRRLLDRLEFVDLEGRAFDCGTPEEFLEANLAINNGESVIHPTAKPGGPVIGSVYLRDSRSPSGHASRGEIRDGFGNVYVSPKHRASSSPCNHQPTEAT